VLFVSIDDLNDWVGCLGGHPQAHTPNLDRFAQQGTLFTRAYCPAPLCNPSRTAVLTGLHPASTGVYHNDQPWPPLFAPDQVLPTYMKAHGYRALGAGKVFHRNWSDPEWAAENVLPWDDSLERPFDPQPPEGRLNGMEDVQRAVDWGPLDVSDEAMGDYKVVDWAASRLREPAEKPFFMAVGLFRPHLPLHAPRHYFERLERAQVELPPTNEESFARLPDYAKKLARSPKNYHQRIEESGNWRAAVHAYLASTSFVDAQVGRLLEALASSPHAGNTIVVLWSDNGFHLGEKRHWLKGTLWEPANRVPLIIRAPEDQRGGQPCGRPVNLLDLFPTLAELCELPPPPRLEGRSLAPLLANPEATWDHPVVTALDQNNQAVRSEHLRYIRYADGTEELYDYRKDPHEWHNLATDPKYAGEKKALAAHLIDGAAPDAPSRLREAPEETKQPERTGG